MEVARRTAKQLGLRAVAGPTRDPAIPAAGVADGGPLTNDLELDVDVGDEDIGAISAPSAGARDQVFTKEERCEGTPPTSTDLSDLIDLEEEEIDTTEDGWQDQSSPVTAREQRVARARRVFGPSKPKQDRGDQADQAAAEDHRTTDVSKMLNLFRSEDDPVIRKALQRLHIKWYHYETERLQSILRAAGVPAKACNLVPQVVQACQVCRPWRRPGQANKFTVSLALAFNEEVQFDLLSYHSQLEPGPGGSTRSADCASH